VRKALALAALVLMAGGSGHAGVSADGGIVAFASDAPKLVAGDTNGVSDVFVRTSQGTERVSVGPGRQAGKRLEQGRGAGRAGEGRRLQLAGDESRPG
jgi:hypothetical protein